MTLRLVAPSNDDIQWSSRFDLWRLLPIATESLDNWQKLDLNIDRAAFNKRLERVREVRNDVMHFNPEGLDDSDTLELLDMARFFQNLVRMGAM